MSAETPQTQPDHSDSTSAPTSRDIAIPVVLRRIFQHCDVSTLLACLYLSSATYDLAAATFYDTLDLSSPTLIDRYLDYRQLNFWRLSTRPESAFHFSVKKYVHNLTLGRHHTPNRLLHHPIAPCRPTLSFPNLHTLRLAVKAGIKRQVIFCGNDPSRTTCPILRGLKPRHLVLDGVDSMNPAVPTGLIPLDDVWISASVLELAMVLRDLDASFDDPSEPSHNQHGLISGNLPPKIEEIRIYLPDLAGATWSSKKRLQYRRQLKDVPAQLARLLAAVDPHVTIIVKGLDRFMCDGPAGEMMDEATLRAEIGELVQEAGMGGEDEGVLDAGSPFATDDTRQLYFVN